ncbi:zinc carboxypeptidase [Nasonia vitripennis]|uniref:Peptidase M14 domain-containing protein n=1 Tax=Nasonia vitripennis TaxID=7425 RepID=A0A7M7IV67_NASVI|nr:zinc carboxypeptidase [Nasonia vitripennis]XP_016842646.1 zinc carboxypeptidase [Nasonia vitripennis]
MLSTNVLYTALLLLYVTTEVFSMSNTASVFRITPKKDEEIKVLYSLDRDVDGIEFWKDPSGINKPVDLMVPENHIETFEYAMKDHDLTYSVLIVDVQKLLNNTTRLKRSKNSENFGFTRFQTLDEIYNWLDNLALAYPNNVEIIVGGKSFEGRPIKGVKLTFAPGKSGVFIEAGIHAREWLSHSTATFLINELLTSNDQDVRKLAQSFEWYVFPCFNPDGYAFTHSEPQNRKFRLWRKTRTPYATYDCWNEEFCERRICHGADLNRNWGFHWGGPGSGQNECAEVFAGPAAFSEIESKTLSEYITSISDKLFAYISFHTYIEKLMFPYGHTSAHLDNYDQQYTVGLEAIDGLSKRYGSEFDVGNIAEILGRPASGGSIDWVKANFEVPFVYCYELRGRTKAGQMYGFVAPPSEIIPSGQEVLDSLVAMFKAAANYYPQLKRTSEAPLHGSESLQLPLQ